MQIKTLIKKNRHLSYLAFSLRRMRNALLVERYSRLPLEHDKVLFYRSGGGYGDNPKPVAEFLHAHYPHMKLVWAYDTEGAQASIPAYVTPVAFESNAFLRELATAGAWVASTIMPHGIRKRPGQLYIQTWHGDKPFKKIARDASDLDSVKSGQSGRVLVENELCDYMLSGTRWFVPIIRSAFGYEGTILTFGTPRNDCLVNLSTSAAQAMRTKLGIPADAGVLIYAPTYRDHTGAHDIVPTNIDLAAIVDALEKKTGKAWLCLMRAHGGRQLKTGAQLDRSKFIDYTTYPDMSDVLMVADALITDYSSCAGDFALTGRFVMLYQDDYDSYTSRDRTLYFDPAASPFFVAHTMDEALDLVRSVSAQDAAENCKAILDFYDACESGESTQKVVDLIVNRQ